MTAAAAIVAGWRGEIARLLANRFDLALVTVVPAFFLFLMGAMVSPGTTRHSAVMIVDRDGGPVARAIQRGVAASPALRIVGVTPDIGAALSAVRSERALAVLVIPKKVGTRDAAPVEILYEAQFLAAGALAQSNLRAVVSATLIEGAPRLLGNADLGALHLAAPQVRVTLLGNQTASLGWYLGLLLGPGVIHLAFAVTAIGSLALLIEDKSFARYAATQERPALTLIGRLGPHVLACWLAGIAWTIWLTVWGDYRFLGSVVAVVVALLLLALATVGVGVLLIAATREAATALSGAVIIAGSALAYSGASLPINGAAWYVLIWNALLPLTHYLRMEMDLVIGAHARPLIVEGVVLALYPLIAGGGGLWLIARRRAPR